jgi:hypothetical protein
MEMYMQHARIQTALCIKVILHTKNVTALLW